MVRLNKIRKILDEMNRYIHHRFVQPEIFRGFDRYDGSGVGN